MSRKGSAAVILLSVAAFVLLAGLAVYFGSGRLYSIIGEEGYEPYDALLSAGSFDQTKWIYSPQQESCKPVYNNPGNVCVKPYIGVSASNGELTVSPISGEPSENGYGHKVSTQNLRLVNFKTSFRVDTANQAGTCLWTNKGTVWCYTQQYQGSAKTMTAGIELRWDDYELGHYQIFVNGAVTPVQEGTIPVGDSLVFYTRPYVPYGNNFGAASGTFVNPRIQQVFNCDLQEGELLTDACFGGPDSITVTDLPRFKRFCLDSASTFVDAGISTNSKRVYYALAKGEAVTIEANQAWKFSYIASAPTIGNRTGISSNCEQVLVNDLKDIPAREPSIQGQTLYWTSQGRYEGTKGYKRQQNELRSGAKAFMSASDVQIDEQACPYKYETQYFPQDTALPESCFSVKAYGKDFHKGDILALNGVVVTLQDVKVWYKQDPDLGKLYTWTADWRLDFQPGAVQIDLASTPEIVDANNSRISYPVKNSLPGPGSFVTTVQVRPEILNSPITTSYTTSVQEGAIGNVTVDLPAAYLGKHEVMVWNTLQTDVGGVAFSWSQATYSTTAQSVESDGFFSRLWQMIVRFLKWLWPFD